MFFLVFSVLAALATSIHTYGETGSFLLAFFVYAATGTMVLISALLANSITHRDDF